jgi:hypothetical protein
MILLKKILDFYIKSSLHVALSVYALVSMTMYFFNISNNFEVRAFAFFGTIVGYNFVKYDALARLNKIPIKKELKLIVVLSLFSALASLYYFIKLQWITKSLGILFFVLVLLYTLPFFPNKQNARNWKGIKIYIVSVCWVGVTVLLPLINAKIPFTFDVLLMSIQRFILIFVLVLIFEIVDINTDDPHLKTVPQQIGIAKTKQLGYVLLIILLLLEFLYVANQDYVPLAFKFIVSGSIASFLYFANENRSRYYASFWVEAIPVFWWFLMLIFK